MISDAVPLWRCMAVIEVGDHIDHLDELIREDGLHYRLTPCASSPKGFLWYELHVDSSGSEHRAARTAWAILWAIKRLAADGVVTDLRIVTGAEWLHVPPSALPRMDLHLSGAAYC